MKNYRSYMERQEMSAAAHDRLISLDVPSKAVRRPWAKYGALAACAVLIAGIGAWRLAPGSAPGPETDPVADAATSTPVQTEGMAGLQPDEAQPVEPSDGFVVRSWAESDKLTFPMVPAIVYQDVDNIPELAASRAFAPGTFTVELTKEDIQDIFWGPEGKPEAEHPKIEQGDLPWTLFWDGYTVHGIAWYDGQGQFTELSIWGEKDRASFSLELRLGALPFTCLAEPDRGDEISQFNGVEITGWSKVYDRDGDGLTDYICGSEFMMENHIGVRFKNQNSSMEAEYGGGSDMNLGGSCTFNALFVRQALTGGLHLDHLMTAGHIPAWRDVTFETLEQARLESEFAPYLPVSEPEGYGDYTGNKEFFGRLSYQEGVQNMLFVRWSREYDTVEIDVSFPEGGGVSRETVDINVPESYDTRLYESPWCDSVPAEYQSGFYSVTFRAEDLTLDAVMAREVPHDTGGMSFHFNVLHSNGVVVSYSCDGMTAQQVWELVENTLT